MVENLTMMMLLQYVEVEFQQSKEKQFMVSGGLGLNLS